MIDKQIQTDLVAGFTEPGAANHFLTPEAPSLKGKGYSDLQVDTLLIALGKVKGNTITTAERQDALAIVLGSGPETQSQAPLPDNFQSLNADQLRMLIKDSRIDVFGTLSADAGFGKTLKSVIESTYENAFKNALKKGAEEAIREASLNLLRDTFVSIAKGSKVGLANQIIANHAAKPGGGTGDGGDPQPDMP